MKVIIAYDKSNSFFSDLAINLRIALNSNSIPFIELTDVNLTSVMIKTEIEQSPENIMFVAYSHGLNDRLCSNENCNSFYVSTSNTNLFNTTELFYTFSCYSGNELADSLIKNGCKSFIGYDDKAYFPAMPSGVIQAINSGIKAFLIEKKSYREVLLTLIDEYVQLIDFYEDSDFPLSVRLSKNRRALVLKP